MNKQLRTIFTMLLLCFLGATNVWAQDNRANNYENNLAFLSATEYVGTSTQYSVAGKIYTNGIKSYPKVQGTNRFPAVAFMMPAGTKYLHFHIVTKTSGGQFAVRAGENTVTHGDLPYNSAYNPDAVTQTFRILGTQHYQVITFDAPLEKNTLVTIISSSTDYPFMVFGVYYEDLINKGSSAVPFTASEAKALANDHVGLVDKVYVKGLVSSAMQLNESSGKGTFYISDDGTSDNQFIVNGCLGKNSAQFENAYQILPRDKVTIYANIATPSNQGLYNGSLYKQIHPSYKLHVQDASGYRILDMENYFSDTETPANWPLHSYNIGHIAAGGDNCWFKFVEKYSDDSNYSKDFFGPEGVGYYTIGWENMDDTPLTDSSSGRLMCVDTEGNYTLYVKQVEDGPKLDVRGFENPRFYLHRVGFYEPVIEMELGDDFVYRASGVHLENGQEFYITKGENGPITYTSCQGGDDYIQQDNCTNVPAYSSGEQLNFWIGATGSFDFSFFVNTSDGSATISVSPTDGDWPAPATFYRINVNGRGYLMVNNGDGTYTLSKYVDSDTRFFVERIADLWRYELGNEEASEVVNFYTDHEFPLVNDGFDFKVADGINTGGTSFELTFTVTDLGDGTSAPTLSITGWPQPNLKIAYDYTEKEFLDYDGDTDTYSIIYEMAAGKVFWFIDKTYGNAILAPQDLTLFRSNSNDIPLQWNLNNGRFLRMGNEASPLESSTFTLKLKPSPGGYLLTVDWPEPDFKLIYGPNKENENIVEPFTKMTNGSWTAQLTVTDYMANNSLFGIDIFDGDFLYGYGVPRDYISLTTENSQNIPLVCGDGSYSIKLPVGTYTLTINPYFTLSIEWPFIVNGDCEGSEQVSFLWKETPGSEVVPAPIYDGVGVDGSRGIEVNSMGNPAQAWDSQFFICLGQPLPEGTKYRISFDYKATQESSVWTQSHGSNPEDYIYWDALGTVIFNTSWQHFEKIGTITHDQSPSDNMQTICFNLAVNSQATIFYFDNIEFEIVETEDLVTNGDIEGEDMSCFWKKEMYGMNTQEPVLATYTAGAGVNGSRGIVVNSSTNASNNWDSGFFIRMNESLPEGTTYRISFDFKADNEAIVQTQIHTEPGNYLSSQAFGEIYFSSTWQHFDRTETVTHAQSPSDDMRTFAFNLNKDKDAANRFYFDNIKVEIVKPELEPEPVWVDIIKNGNIEADDMSCFKKIEQVGDHPGELVTASFTEGVGKKGTRGIVVQSRDNPDPSTTMNDWDTQFFVRLPQTLPAGTKYRISFDYRANKEATAKTQMHAEPANYLSYNGIGSVNFNLGWQHFEQSGTITRDQSPSDNMQTICFNLAVKKSATTYYFDNFVFEIDEDNVNNVLMGDVNGDNAVTIQDVVLLVDYTLNKPISGFTIEAADVTGDGLINISDVVAIVNLVLKKN